MSENSMTLISGFLKGFL